MRPEVIDATDIAGINNRLREWARPDERIVPVSIERIVIEEDAVPALVSVAEQAAGNGTVLLVCDDTPKNRGGDALLPALEDALATRVKLNSFEVSSHDTCVETADALAAELDDVAVVLAVGSGSITDVVKYARHRVVTKHDRRLPMICFPTAASVTAYSSALAVMNVDGVKRTLPAQAPDVVICDLRTLADAPGEMTAAGFGDALARLVCYADWYCANQLGMDDTFSEIPARLLGSAEQAMIASAPGVAEGTPDAIRAVLVALLLDGIAMSAVSQTAPLSGWEHAISHYLDLTAAGDHRPAGLHGAQVGVGTIIAARAYERMWSKLDFERVRDDIDAESCRGTLVKHFAAYDRNGKLVEELWNDLKRKLQLWEASHTQRARFAEHARSGDLHADIRRRVTSASTIQAALQLAGAPSEHDQLPVTAENMRQALRHAHLIRARFTLGDLLAHCGALHETSAVEGLLT